MTPDFLVIRRPTAAADPPHQARHSATARRRIHVRAAIHDPRFWVLAVAFVAHAAAMSTMTVHLVGILTSRGHPATFAATVAGLLGILSVTGRLLLTATRRRLRLAHAVAAIFAVQAIAALCLAGLAGNRVGAIAAVTAFGIGFGVASLAVPTLLADRYGTAAYGTIAGTLATPVTLAKAGAPLAAAGIASATGSYTAVLLLVGLACLIAGAGTLAAQR